MAVLDYIKELSQNIHALSDDLKKLDQKFDKHVTTQSNDLKTAMDNAFPEGDASGHRRHHEALIKAAEERAKFWGTMRTEIAKWGLIGFLGWVLYAAWTTFLQGPHK